MRPGRPRAPIGDIPPYLREIFEEFEERGYSNQNIAYAVGGMNSMQTANRVTYWRTGRRKPTMAAIEKMLAELGWSLAIDRGMG